MDIIISYRWLKEYLKTAAAPEEVARLLTLHAHTVDRVEKVEHVWKGVVTAKILEIKKHPNADKLQLVKVTDGKSEMEVVCGAWNIAVGQVAPFARVGCTVRDGKTGKPWTLTAANIRGAQSQGMLCAVDELGIGDDHTGIWILPPDTKIGVPLEDVFPVQDTIFQIEVTSNRPDCMSVQGLAREAAAILPKAKLIYRNNVEISKYRNVDISKYRGSGLVPLTVKVLESKLCPRYQAVVIAGVKVGLSPLWLQQRLLAAGQRPINNLVDITNYVRLEYGNPLHVFDYAKLDGQKIIVRRAKAGEMLLALDGKTYHLATSDIIIADGKKPVAIAGVMGGEKSAAGADTKTIVFEVANFDPATVRKTSRRLSLLSDSSLLFEKGLPPQATEIPLLRAIQLTQEIAGGKVASKIFDVKRPLSKPKSFTFDPRQVNQMLGVAITPSASKKILQTLGFSVAGTKTWKVTPPWWRADVAAPHDVVEEVARMYGYHCLPATLPTGQIPVRARDPRLELTGMMRNRLVGLGFTELKTYSLVSAKMLAGVGVNSEQCLRISNPLSAEFEYLRPTLGASVLSAIGQNIKRFHAQLVFEIASIFHPKPKDLPSEVRMLSVAITGGDQPFFAAKGALEFLLRRIGIKEWQCAPDQTCRTDFWQEHGEILVAARTAQGKVVGQLGLVSGTVCERFGIRQPVALFGLNLEMLAALPRPGSTFRPIPEFPASDRDLALVVASDLPWQRLHDAIRGFDPLIKSVQFLSMYRDAKIPAGKKSVACRIEFRADDRTLASGEVDGILQKLVAKLQRDFSAGVR